MAKNLMAVVIVGAVALLVASALAGTIATNIADANLTGFDGTIWGLLVGLFGVGILIAILKMAGVEI